METAEVYQYRISTDTWTTAPDLNQCKSSHSSCVVENTIYVCGGYSRQFKFVDSIERINVSEKTGILAGSHWETLNVTAPNLRFFLMVPVTSSQILFLGAQRCRDVVGEVSVLNLADLRWRIFFCDASYCFYSWPNSYSLSKNGEVTAVVTKPNRE